MFLHVASWCSVCPLCRNGCRCCSVTVLSAAVRRAAAAQRTRRISWNSVSPAAGEWACLVVLQRSNIHLHVRTKGCMSLYKINCKCEKPNEWTRAKFWKAECLGGKVTLYSMQYVSVWSICFKWLFMGNLVCAVLVLWNEYERERER